MTEIVATNVVSSQPPELTRRCFRPPFLTWKRVNVLLTCIVEQLVVTAVVLLVANMRTTNTSKDDWGDMFLKTRDISDWCRYGCYCVTDSYVMTCTNIQLCKHLSIKGYRLDIVIILHNGSVQVSRQYMFHYSPKFADVILA